MRKYIYYMVSLLLPLLLAGCAVHQWPEQVLPEHVKIRLHFEPDMWLWEHLYDPKLGDVKERYPDSGVDEGHPGTSDRYSNEQKSGLMKISLRFYEKGNMANCVAEYSVDRNAAEGYDCDVEVDLFEGNYEVVVWSHLLERNGSQPFYEPADFRAIYLIEENYRGSTDYRDGFRGRDSFSVFAGMNDVDEEEVPVCVCEVEMRRPMGKFEFVTTDLSEFLERETERRALSTRAGLDDYRVVITYPYYYPNAYSAFSDDISSGSGYGFETRMTMTGESEASMGFDYVFIRNISDGAVQAQVAVYDRAGVRVANSLIIKVPIRRDYHTVLRGSFLSMGAQGGVGVIPDYDGDHNVTIP